jgi:MFS superfamily sulfate permease-like transporter
VVNRHDNPTRLPLNEETSASGRPLCLDPTRTSSAGAVARFARPEEYASFEFSPHHGAISSLAWFHSLPLLAVLLATIAVTVFDLDPHRVPVVGTVTGGLPSPPGLPTLPELQLGLLVIGYTDVVLTARAFAARGGYKIDANQELFALGAWNS